MHKNLSQYQFDGINARDEFKREPVAEKIIKLLTSDIDLSPMIIDGDWGTGKSEFCHKLINKFRAEHADAQILYIDAFQADHADNPMMTILAEIMTLVPADKKEAFLEKAIPVARYAIKTGLKALVSHVLRINAEDIPVGIEQNIKDASNRAIDASVEAILKDHEQAEQNLKSLQILLATLAKEQPIIIFIDELDRCRPDFSVHMLEVIKHTFNVKNVKFVLVTNTSQLKAAINHAYGTSINATRYLDKFIKFTIELPDKIITYNPIRQLASVKYFTQLIQSHNTLKESLLSSTYDKSIEFFARELIIANNLSLREIETFVRHLEIADLLGVSFNEDISFGIRLLNLIAVFIDCFKPNLYKDIKNNRVDANNISALISSETFHNEYINATNGIILLLASSSATNTDKIISRINEYTSSGNSTLDKMFWGMWGFEEVSYFNPIIKTIDTLHLR